MVDVPGAPQRQLDALIPRRTPSGRTIQRRHSASTPLEALNLVARGLIVHPTTPATARLYRYPGVTYLPLHGLPPTQSALVWRMTAETAAIRSFAKAAEAVGAPPPAAVSAWWGR